MENGIRDAYIIINIYMYVGGQIGVMCEAGEQAFYHILVAVLNGFKFQINVLVDN